MSNKIRRSTPEDKIGNLLRQSPEFAPLFNQPLSVVPSVEEENYPLQAFLPFFTSRALEATITSYQLKAAQYNQRVRLSQKKVKKYNDRIAMANNNKKASTVLIKAFKSHNQSLNVWDFNTKAYDFNQKNGHIIPLRKPQELKAAHEMTFNAFLKSYSQKIRQLRRSKQESNISPYLRVLYKAEFNTKHLENLRHKNGTQVLYCCPDTMLLHKQRLIEAGVLINNTFHSNKQGTQHFISPEIITIFDDHTDKFVFADNQILNKNKAEEFRDVFNPTRAIVNLKRKEAVDKPTTSEIRKKNNDVQPLSDTVQAVLLNTGLDHPSDEVLPSATLTPRKTQTSKNNQEKTTESDQKNENSAKNDPRNRTETEHDKYIGQLLVLLHVFAKDLTDGKYQNHPGESLDTLKYQANYGAMSRENFRQVLIYELFKQFSKLYIDHPHFEKIYAREWMNAISLWMNSKVFRTKSGDLLTKNKMIEHYQQFLFTLCDKKWGALPDVETKRFIPWQPTVYLNPINTSAGTFMHHCIKTKRNSIAHMKRQQKLQAKAIKQAKTSKKYTDNVAKLNVMIARYRSHQINYEALYGYCQRNTPLLLISLHKHLENYQNQVIRKDKNPYKAA